MKNKLSKLFSLAAVALLLSGCLNNLEGQNETVELGPDEVVVQTTANQLSNEYYRSVILDNRYQLSASASADTSLSSSGNSFAFEEGLLRISQDIFPTDQYYMQEGQLIDGDTLTNWVSRESETNPEGLNPALPVTSTQEETTTEESVDPADDPEGIDETAEVTEESNQVIVDLDSSPIYLSQIMEKNIMVETDEGFALGGIVIGLAMNSVYQYTDAEGVVYEQEISLGEMRERGKAYANIIVGRLRNTEQLRSVPIVVGIFQQAPSNTTVGGNYVLDGISREGNYVTDWTERNEYRVSLPVINNTETGDQYLFFDTFRQDIINFFPHLNGISGEALYIENGLATLDIEIITQFYSQTEITALTQHVTDVAQRTLPEGIGLEIKIQSAAGTEAFVGRQPGESQISSHVFRQ